MTSDPYTILGVERWAEAYEIKRAYKILALTCHPDKPLGNIEKFQMISSAFATIGDPLKRSLYDLKNTECKYADTLIETIVVEVTLDEFILGGVRHVQDHVLSPCLTCDGTGAADLLDFIRCLSCNGKGKTANDICKSCGGEGGCNISLRSCKDCKGGRHTSHSRGRSVLIPPCVEDMQVLHEVSQHDGVSRHIIFHASLSPTLFNHPHDLINHPGVSYVALQEKATSKLTVCLTIEITLAEMLGGFTRRLYVFGESVHVHQKSYEPSICCKTRPFMIQKSCRPERPFLISIFITVIFPSIATVRPFLRVFERILNP